MSFQSDSNSMSAKASPFRFAPPVTAPAQDALFITWKAGDEHAQQRAMEASYKAVMQNEPIRRTAGSNIYQGVAPRNVSVRDSMTRDDYDYLRPDGALPKKPKEKIRSALDAYENFGLIRNVFDLMSDFALQGICLNHPNERIEKFYREWFRRVRGPERSEHFLNQLFLAANLVVQRSTAKITPKNQEEMQRAQAKKAGTRTSGADIEIEPSTKLGVREIPWKYTFKHPCHLDLVSEEMAVFVGPESYTFSMKIPPAVVAIIKKPKKSASEAAMVSKLPDYVVEAAKKGQDVVLDPSRVRAFYYKKKDWEAWATPLVTPILRDLRLLEKVKLADEAALDGAISCIRVWKLGNIEAKMMPTPEAINRLAEMLMNNVGGGVMDLVWGPGIELIETNTDVHKFLGETKYAPVLAQIFSGLGIPPTLVGSSSEGGFTNNAISLKTLIQRMEYGRMVLLEFWNEEIRLVQKAMNFRFPATLGFDRMTLMDESSERALFIQLLDRTGASVETIQEIFGMDPEIEKIRIKREERRQKSGQMPPKAGPYYVADKAHDLKKTFVGSGIISPSEVGVELQPRKAGEMSPAEHQAKQQERAAKIAAQNKPAGPAGADNAAKPKGKSGQGRPTGSNDKKKRKQKVVKPRTSAALLGLQNWADTAQAKIAEIAAPAWLGSLGKKSLRELTTEEARSFETFRFHVLCGLQPYSSVTEEEVVRLSGGKSAVPPAVQVLLRAALAKHTEQIGQPASMEMARRYQSGAYAFWHLPDEDEADAEGEE